MSTLSQVQAIAPELTAVVKQELSLQLSIYAELKLEADLLIEQMSMERASMFAKLEAAGIEKTIIDQIPLTIVRSSSNSLDKKQFVALGGSLKLLDAATVKTPRAPYLKITIGNDTE